MVKTKEKLKIVVFLLFFIVLKNSSANAAKDISESDVSKQIGLDSYISVIDEYVKESSNDQINMQEIAQDLLEDKKIDHLSIAKSIIKLGGKEIVLSIKSMTIIFIVIVLMAVISTFDIEENGDITKIAKLTCFIALSIFMVNNFLEIIKMFKSVVNILTMIMEVVSPFLLTVLISTGAISTTGMIQPLLLFLASLIGFTVTYIIVPCFMISIAFNVIYSVSENLNINKISKMFSGISLWIIGIIFTVFLGVLSLETQISSSVDSLTVKTTQAAVSNFVPVVGKFFSDSFESVVGATKIVGKVGGIVGIIAIILVSLVPVIKLGSIIIVYSLLSALAEMICSDEKIIKYIESYVAMYKNLFGVLIGIIILFIISTGIILNLSSSIVK